MKAFSLMVKILEINLLTFSENKCNIDLKIRDDKLTASKMKI